MASSTQKSYHSSETTITTSTSLVPIISKFQRILWLGNILYYQIVAVLTVLMCWVFFDNNKSNQPILWHMFFATIAYVPLMAVAIISFSRDNLPTLYISRKRIYTIHGALLIISLLSVTIGISIEINSKNKNAREHFKSTHAILGLTSWILVICASTFGIGAAKSQVVSRYMKPLLVKLIHNLLGIMAFTLGVLAIIYMYNSHHYEMFLPSSAFHASYYGAIYIILWSLIAAFQSLFYQIKGLAS